MIIRVVKKDDFPQLIWEKSLEEYQEGIRNALEKSLEGKNIYLVAELNGKVVGQIQATLPTLETSPYMLALRVEKSYRNQLIGTKLIQFLEAELRKKKYQKVLISVALDNPHAKRLYERLGYKVTKQRLDSWSYTKNGKIKTFQEEVFDLEKEL